MLIEQRREVSVGREQDDFGLVVDLPDDIYGASIAAICGAFDVKGDLPVSWLCSPIVRYVMLLLLLNFLAQILLVVLTYTEVLRFVHVH